MHVLLSLFTVIGAKYDVISVNSGAEQNFKQANLTGQQLTK